MAYYFLTASKDASVYLQQPNQNTGLDEILEVSKVFYGNVKDVSHALLKFELGYLSASLTNGSIGMSEAILMVKESQAEERTDTDIRIDQRLLPVETGGA